MSGFNTLRVIDLLCTKRAYYTVCVCVFLKNDLEARVHNSWLHFCGVGDTCSREHGSG